MSDLHLFEQRYVGKTLQLVGFDDGVPDEALNSALRALGKDDPRSHDATPDENRRWHTTSGLRRCRARTEKGLK